jgi:hypothetical protein
MAPHSTFPHRKENESSAVATLVVAIYKNDWLLETSENWRARTKSDAAGFLNLWSASLPSDRSRSRQRRLSSSMPALLLLARHLPREKFSRPQALDFNIISHAS